MAASPPGQTDKPSRAGLAFVLAIAALAALIGGLVLYATSGGDEASASAAPAAAGPSSPAAPGTFTSGAALGTPELDAPLRKDAAGQAHAAAEPAALARAAGVIEVAVKADGKPAAGARVSLYQRGLRDPNTNELDWPAAGAATTDAAGLATLPAAPGVYLLAARLDGFGPTRQRVTRLAGEPKTHVDLTLGAGHALAGHVVGGRGEPLAEAEVTLVPMTDGHDLPSAPADEKLVTATDARGGFAFAAVGKGVYRAQAKAVGYAPNPETLVSVPEQASVTLTLVSAATIEGFVKSADGKPAAGAEVMLTAGEAFTSTTTGPGGGFAVEVEPGVWRISARWQREAGALPNTVTVTSGKSARVELTLGPGAAIAGSVTNMKGEPVVGADILVSPYLRSGDSGRARTGDDGSFAVEALPPGSYDLVARAPGYTEQMKRAIAVNAGERFEVGLVMDSSGRVTGVVKDAQGNPVPSAVVRLSRAGWREPPLEGRADASGAFTFEGVQAGRADLSASREGGRPGPWQSTVVRGEETAAVELTLEDDVEVKGMVVDRNGRAPSQPMPVWAACATPGCKGRPRSAMTEEDGSFAFGLSPGTWRLASSSLADGSGTTTVEVQDGRPTRVELRLTDAPPAKLEGKVLEPGGQPSEWARVRVTAGKAMTWAMTDESGTFTTALPGGESDELSIVAWNGGRTGETTVRRGASPTVQLRPGARLLGKVTDASGVPVRGFRVSVETAEAHRRRGEGPWEFPADQFDLTDQPALPLKLVVTTPDGRRGEATVSPPSAGTAKVEVAIAPAAGLKW